MTRTLCTFVPGIKGTELWCDVCKRKAWPPAFLEDGVEFSARIARNGFSICIENMMNSDEYNCLKNHDKTPVRIIYHVNTMWGVYRRDVYGKFLKRLKREIVDNEEENVTIDTMTFPYDWTRSNIESAHRLYYRLLEAAETYDNVILIAHSMGGLVCRYLLENVLPDVQCLHNGIKMRRRLSSKIKLFYGIGVPHYGCVKALHHLVNTDNAAFSSFCRNVDSLYEMIPFSDVIDQIEGLHVMYKELSCAKQSKTHNETMDQMTATIQQERHRSNMFVSIGERVVVDPRNWRLTTIANRPKDNCLNGDSIRQQNMAAHQQYLIDALISRFPVLNGHLDKLYEGYNFHLSLNTDHKPPWCAYVLINATGIFSPSKIDMHGQLERHCLKGDGTVCSIVNKRKLRSGRYANRRKVKRPTKKTLIEPITAKNQYTDNVHVSMINDVDLITPIRNIARSNAPNTSNWNVRNIVWDHVRFGQTTKANRKKSLGVWTAVSDAITGCLYSVPRRGSIQPHYASTDDIVSVKSKHTISVDMYSVHLYNLSNGYCIVSLVKTEPKINVSLAKDSFHKSLILIARRDQHKQRRCFRRLLHGNRVLQQCKNYKRITFCTNSYGNSWNGLQVITAGSFVPVSLRIDDTVDSTLPDAN